MALPDYYSPRPKPEPHKPTIPRKSNTNRNRPPPQSQKIQPNHIFLSAPSTPPETSLHKHRQSTATHKPQPTTTLLSRRFTQTPGGRQTLPFSACTTPPRHCESSFISVRYSTVLYTSGLSPSFLHNRPGLISQEKDSSATV